MSPRLDRRRWPWRRPFWPAGCRRLNTAGRATTCCKGGAPHPGGRARVRRRHRCRRSRRISSVKCCADHCADHRDGSNPGSDDRRPRCWAPPTNGLLMMPSLRARTSLPPPQLSVESAHAAATPLKTWSTTATTSQHAKLVLSSHGPRDKRVELGDQCP